MAFLESMTKKILEDQKYNKIYQLLKKELQVEDLEPFIRSIYISDYQRKDPKEVYQVLLKNRRRKSSRWYEKVIEGYNDFLKDNTQRKGFYSYLVRYHTNVESFEKKSGTSIFEKTFNVESGEMLINNMVDDLTSWKQTEDYFVRYPFFNNLSKKMKQRAVEDDLAEILGEWLTLHKDNLTSLISGKKNPVSTNQEEIDEDVSQTPVVAMDSPLFSNSDRVKYQLVDEEGSLFGEEGLLELEKRRKHELPPNMKIAYSTEPDDDVRIKVPDMKDRRIFDLLLNYRDPDFQVNRRIFAYLSDIRKEIFKSDGTNSIKELKHRLLRLGLFRVIHIEENSSFEIKNLFSDIKVKEDQMGNAYVDAIVSEQLYNNIIEHQFIKIYGGKPKELSNDLAYHLSFLIQRKRIQHHIDGEDDITFELRWNELNTSIIFNKRYKSENMNDVAEALMELKERIFLVDDFQRYKSDSFYLTCFPLKDVEIRSINVEKLSLEDGVIENLLIEQEQDT